MREYRLPLSGNERMLLPWPLGMYGEFGPEVLL